MSEQRRGEGWGFGSRSHNRRWCWFQGRKGVVLVDLGNFKRPMVVENHHELVFLGSKEPLCT